jgi:surface polysaccharide O-acyltransferase-like enzyme
MVEKSNSRILYYDLLNICACFCVIALHCNGISHFYSDTLGWKQALSVEVIAFWAVPIFFMLSGATLFNYRKRYDTKTFLKKRLVKTFIPFIFWTVINIFWKQFLGDINIGKLGVRGVIDMAVNTKIENVYWFFIPLFAIYLVMPVLSLLTDDKSRKTLWYIFVLSFVLQGCIPFLFSFIGLNYNFALNAFIGNGFLMFTVLGYLLSTEEIDKKHRMIIYGLGIFSVLLRYFSVLLLSEKNNALDQHFFDYNAFYSVFLAAAIFVLFKSINWNKLFKTDKSQRNISLISSCSFGIYLIHMFVLKVITHFSENVVPAWTLRIFGPFIIYILCLAAVMIIKKIPVLKKTVP